MLKEGSQQLGEFYQVEPIKGNFGLHGFIAIHKLQNNIGSLGATRVWSYETEDDALQDALELSKLMTYKCTMAGLLNGGAKAVLINNSELKKNKIEAFKIYAEIINNLSGKFLTGADVGIQDNDLALLCQKSPYVLGKGVKAGYFTALGVFYGIQSVIQFLDSTYDISNKTFAIQGLGKTGFQLLKLLYAQQPAKIYAADIDPLVLQTISIEFPEVDIIDISEIHKQPVDVFCPCALGHAINKYNVNELRCRAIIGAANNQLESPDLGKKLLEQGIIYAPDYIVNVGGLISVVDQYDNVELDEKRIDEKLIKMQYNLKTIIEKSLEENKPTNIIADDIAERVLRSNTLC